MAEIYLKKLNLGCGRDTRDGWVNLDSVNLPGVNVVHDIEKIPFPFPADEFDEILCRDVLEHVDYPLILQELHRILKPGGKIAIRVPHFTSKNNYADPTHKRLFSILTFEFFVQTPSYIKARDRKYYFRHHFGRMASSRIVFEKTSRWLIYNRLVEPLVNISKRMQYFYEATGFARIFPAENIEVELIK